MKEFLPVGSVVLLKDAKKPLIIIGHSALEGNNKIWDYIGAIYPFGRKKVFTIIRREYE